MSHPRFNHVAMSLPADALGERGRADIARFYEEVFGWEVVPQMTEDRKRLVLTAYRYGQFVFLIADETPMTAPRMDHFGMGVDTMDELDAFGGGRSRRRRRQVGRDVWAGHDHQLLRGLSAPDDDRGPALPGR